MEPVPLQLEYVATNRSRNHIITIAPSILLLFDFGPPLSYNDFAKILFNVVIFASPLKFILNRKKIHEIIILKLEVDMLLVDEIGVISFSFYLLKMFWFCNLEWHSSTRFIL